MRHFSQPSEIGRELPLQIHVDAKNRQKFALRAIKRIGSGRHPWQDLVFGNLIVASIIFVNADELTVEKSEVHPQICIEHARDA